MNTLSFPLIESRSRLLKCLAISLAVHAACLTIFYFHPLILQSSLQSLFGLSSAKPTRIETEEEEAAEFVQKNHLLEEVFQQIVVLSPHLQQPYDLVELPKGIALAPSQEDAVLPDPQEMKDPHPSVGHKEFIATSKGIIHDHEERTVPTLFTPPENGTPIASQLQIDAELRILEIPMISVPFTGLGAYEDLMTVNAPNFNPIFETDYALNLSPQLISANSLKIGEDLQLKLDSKPMAAHVTTNNLHLDKETSRPTLFIPKAATSLAEKKNIEIASALSDLDDYDFPPMARAAEWNDDFDIDVVFLPNPEGQGYIFSLSLNPNYDISCHSLKQNLYFILDRSNSVQRHRFAVFKRAVLKALASMNQGDTFNIFIMDRKILSFSPTNRPVSMKNIQAAEEFLDKQDAGGLFAGVDIYTSIEKILPNIAENEEMHTAILLTDGKTSLNAERKQVALKKWIEKNNGKVSLYTAAVGRDNDLLSLDLLSSVSGGKLLYSDTHASFPRKLAKLVIDLKDPVAKDLMITAVPLNPHSHIEFYPATSHLPSLYSHKPYTVVGKIDDPCAFDLVIQGRHGDSWVAIKKSVSFIEGKKGDQQFQKQWDAEKVNICYSKFLKEGKVAHLKEANDILKKSRFDVVFE